MNQPIEPVTLSQSGWGTYQKCDRLYGWKYIEEIEPIGSDNHALVLGGAVHKGLEIASLHKDGLASQEALDRALEASDVEIKKRLGTFENFEPAREEIEDLQKESRKLISAYRRHWLRAGDLWKPLGVEVEFIVEVGEDTNVYLKGIVDNLGVQDGGIWIVDHKTSKRLDMRDFRKYEIDVQLTGYIYGVTKQLTQDAAKEDKPPVIVRGAVIDLIVKTKVPQFHRERFTRSVDDLIEFEKEFCLKAWEIGAKRAVAKKNRQEYEFYNERIWETTRGDWKSSFAKNTNACFMYRMCEFHDLCTSDNEIARAGYRPREDRRKAKENNA